MVTKMADQSIRSPSPPLPPDPAPLPSKLSMSQDVPRAAGSQQQTSPITLSSRQPQPDLRRIETSRTPQQSAPVSPILQQRQPITDAVTEAFEHSPATNQLDPEFIKQVAEQVLKNLQAVAAPPTASAQSQQTQYPPPPPPPPPTQQPQSPIQSSVSSPTERFTPPTPERTQEARDVRGDKQASVEDDHSDSDSSWSHGSGDSIRSSGSLKSAETPKPSKSESSGTTRRTKDTSRRRSSTIPQSGRVVREGSGSDSTARGQTPARRDSKDPQAPHDGIGRSQVPPPPDAEETPLEKFWQPLFINGNPTMRLSQFLRGLAICLIDDYEPKSSIVVTPEKMLRFLNETKVDEEHYPWETIFGGSLAPTSISIMYQKLLCQHHLVQDRYDRMPTVPGLTPLGFDWFMTCLIQAHPNTEYERLAKAVMNMPISNADNKSERFPKELSRRLLPAKANIQAEQRLISSLNHEPHVVASLKGTSHMPPPPPPPSAPPIFSGERERQPYSRASQQSNLFDDDDLNTPTGTGNTPSVPIERERKPYSGKEGAGKTHEDGRPNTNHYRPENPQFSNTRPSRAQSGVPPPAMYGSSGPSDAMNIPQRQTHRMSVGQGPPPMANSGYSRSSRRSPPPMKNPFARSEPEFVGSMPNSQYNSNLHPAHPREQYPGDPDEEQFRRYHSRSRADRSNSGREDDDTSGGRGYPIPGRGVPINNGFEYGAGPAGGPPMGDPRSQQGGGIPVGSYPSRRHVGSFGAEDRRKSMYGSPAPGMGGGDGGTDGYGSFAQGMNGGPGYPPQQSYGSSVQH